MNKDWFDTMIELSKKISNIDCDLVLLYAAHMHCHFALYYLIDQIKTIYVGGILQLYMGVLGGRWEKEERYSKQLNLENFIRPLKDTQIQDKLIPSAEPIVHT